MGASVDLDELLLKLKWTEEGAQIPDRARAQLAKLREEQERLARTPVAPALGPGGAIGGRNAFQAGWATQSQILQTMQRDAGRATTAVTQLGSATGSAGAATVGATRNIHFLRTALTGLAFQATGTTGPLGRVASSLVLFGAGSTITLGAAAGIALVAGAFHLLTRAARESEEQVRLARERLKGLQEQRDPALSIQREIEQAEAKLRAAQARLKEENDRLNRLAKERIGLAEPLGVTLTLSQARQDLLKAGAVPDLRRASTETATLTALLDELRLKLTEIQVEARKAEESLVLALRAGDLGRARGVELSSVRALSSGAFRPPTFGTGAGGAVLFPAFNAGPAAGSFGAAARAAQGATELEHFGRALDFTRGVLVRTLSPQQIFNQGLQQLQLVLDSGAITTDQFSAAVAQLTDDMKKATKGSKVLEVAIIGAVAGAINAMMHGGSAGSIIGGILGTVGGILSIGGAGIGAANPLLGAALAGFGTILSGVGSGRGVRIDSYSREALEQLRGIPAGPQRIELLIQSPTTGEIVDRVIYTLGERTRNDGVRRVPLILAGR